MNKKEEQQKEQSRTENALRHSKWKIKSNENWVTGQREKREEMQHDKRNTMWEIPLQFFIQNSRTTLSSRNGFEENLQIV